MHIRAALRQAVRSALMGLPSIAGNVFVDRVYALQAADTPCLLLSVSEAVDLDGLTGVQRRTLGVSVEALAKVNHGLSDTLDDIGVEVEEALAAPITLGGKPGNLLTYTGADAPTLAGEGERPVGSLVMNFELLVFTQAGAPEALL